MRLWKVLDNERRSVVSGTHYQYPPDGKWTGHCRKPIALCEWGFHYCEGKQILRWLREGLLVEVEPCPKHEPLRADDKAVSCSLRIIRIFPLDARTLRLFACDCAERALLRERERGREPDVRSWKAVEVARRYANGEATDEERSAAAYYASAYAAAYAATDATYAAADAAYAAAYAATDATYAAERDWQYKRLLELVGAEEES